MELCDLPAHQIVELIRSKQASAEEVLDSALQRIAQVDGRPGALDSGPALPEDAEKVHAFITLTAEQARRQAQTVDRMIHAGEDPGCLAGVPVTIKDIFAVQGATTTAASRILANFHPPYTATPVQRMQQAGAVVLGKVNLDEFAFGSSNESSAFQPSPRNPWDPSRVPGGSSGGSAASVAAGECQLSLGTDTAGSIRQPAAFCGIVGLKPTYGRVSRYGMFAFSSSLDCPGPIAKNIHDAALMLKVIAGADPYDATSASLPVPDYPAALGKSIRGMRIGLSPDYFRIIFPDQQTGELQKEAISRSIEQTVLQAANRLAELGAEIVEDVPLPHTGYSIPTFLVISRVEVASNLHRYDGVKYGRRTPAPVADLQEMYRRSRAEGLGQQAKLRILMGMYMSEAEHSEQYYHRARRVRTLIRRDFETVFDPRGAYRLDALLTPTTPTTAFPIANVFGDSVLMQYADQFAVPANHAGIPGLALPAGFDEDGLPIGMQLLGPDFSEERLFQIGYAYETVTATDAWRARRPPILGG